MKIPKVPSKDPTERTPQSWQYPLLGTSADVRACLMRCTTGGRHVAHSVARKAERIPRVAKLAQRFHKTPI